MQLILFLELFKDSDLKDKTSSKFCSGWIIGNYNNKTIGGPGNDNQRKIHERNDGKSI